MKINKKRAEDGPLIKSSGTFCWHGAHPTNRSGSVIPTVSLLHEQWLGKFRKAQSSEAN